MAATIDFPPPNPPPTGATIPFPPAPPTDSGLPGWPEAAPTLNNLIPSNLWGWGCTRDMRISTGLACAPPAAPVGSALIQFWRAHTGMAIEIISCVSIGIGTVNPQMPSPRPVQIADGGNYGQPGNPLGGSGTYFPADNNPVLLEARLVRFSPENLPDGTQRRGVIAVYVFAYQLAPTIGVDNFDFGASPFDVTPAALNVLRPSDFYSYLSQTSAVQQFIAPLPGGFGGGSSINY